MIEVSCKPIRYVLIQISKHFDGKTMRKSEFQLFAGNTLMFKTFGCGFWNWIAFSWIVISSFLLSILKSSLFIYIPLRAEICRRQHSIHDCVMHVIALPAHFLIQRRNLPIRLKASVNLFASLSVPPAALRLDAPKLLSSRAKNKFRTWKNKLKMVNLILIEDYTQKAKCKFSNT